MTNFINTQIPGVRDPIAYSKPPILIFVSYNSISQPVFVSTTLIPGVQNPLKSLTTVVVPTGYASWASSTISQPYFPATDINRYNVSTSDVGTYSKPPAAPAGASSWLNKSISNPYITLYDINNSVYNPNAGNLRGLVITAPTGYASWASQTIGQPRIVLYDINTLANVFNPLKSISVVSGNTKVIRHLPMRRSRMGRLN